jgi:hypothetical protein
VETAGMEIFSLGKQVKGMWRYKSRVGDKIALFGFEGEGTQRYLSKECAVQAILNVVFHHFFQVRRKIFFPHFSR